MDARGKFGEHKWIKSNSCFSVALQTSQVQPRSDGGTAESMNQFFYDISTKKINKLSES